MECHRWRGGGEIEGVVISGLGSVTGREDEIEEIVLCADCYK